MTAIFVAKHSGRAIFLQNININLTKQGAPSKKTNGIFSDIVQKGGRGSSSNHLFKCLRKNDKLQGGGVGLWAVITI